MRVLAVGLVHVSGRCCEETGGEKILRRFFVAVFQGKIWGKGRIFYVFWNVIS